MKQNDIISEYRDRLDKTLSFHDLTNVETLRGLVINQFAHSPQIDANEDVDNNIVGIRTAELSNFLGMLRSTSDDGWNVKQDSEEYRVMYREGPKGSPFHTLLVEGYVDGPVDVCLCISWEAELYPKWWPQTVVPAFKITSSRCLKKIRAGEQICLISMKVSWPLSAREAMVHYFEFEYFQDDLVVVLLNSISDLGGISKSTHGFTRDGIPDAEDVIRIDVIGGFAIQKVSENRSFFRTIANMDIKLNFIPPAFINFISRQLIGSGFKLYKKEVDSVTKGDDDFGKALTHPLYVRVREAKYSDSLSAIKAPQSSGEQQPHAKEDETGTSVNKIDNDYNNASEGHIKENPYSEIEEIKEEGSESMNIEANISSSFVAVRSKKKAVIRPEVEKALRTLEMAIAVIRQRGLDNKTPISPVIRVDEDSENPYKNGGTKESISSDTTDQIVRKDGMRLPSPLLMEEDTKIVTSIEARNSYSSIVQSQLEKITHDNNNVTDQTTTGNDFDDDHNKQIRKKRKPLFRCLHACVWR